MGLFGGPDTSAQDAQQRQLQQQIDQNKADLALERDQMYQQRLNIVKSETGQAWSAPTNSLGGLPPTKSQQLQDRFTKDNMQNHKGIFYGDV